METQEPSSSGISFSTQQLPQPSVPQQPTDEHLPDALELMHQYTAYTYLTISDSVDFQPIWQHTVPKEALTHDFLMHGILALAALHIAHERPEQEDLYISSALRHHNTAIVSFRSALQQVTEENCHAMFAFSTILLVLTLAFAQTGIQERDSIQDLIQIFTLLQGTCLVLESAMKWITTGPLEPLVRRGLAGRNRAQEAAQRQDNSTDPAEQALNSLEEYCQRTVESPSSSDAYSLAIGKLRGCAARARQNPGDHAAVVGWLVLVNSEYIDSVKNKDPVALVIMGLYGVLLDKLKGEWWILDMGERIVEAICEQIPAESLPLMDWALRQVGLRQTSLNEDEHA